MSTPTAARPPGPSKQFLVSTLINTAIYLVVYAAAYNLWPFRYDGLDTQARFFHALMLCVAPAVLLNLLFNACLRAMDGEASDKDPLGGHETQKWKINNRVYGNTVEQWSMFLPLVLAAAVYLSPERFKAVPVAMTLWMIGRVMFWVGYRIAPPKRNLGMEFTAYSAASLLVWMVVTAL